MNKTNKAINVELLATLKNLVTDKIENDNFYYTQFTKVLNSFIKLELSVRELKQVSIQLNKVLKYNKKRMYSIDASNSQIEGYKEEMIFIENFLINFIKDYVMIKYKNGYTFTDSDAMIVLKLAYNNQVYNRDDFETIANTILNNSLPFNI